jgi:hypothetical protein
MTVTRVTLTWLQTLKLRWQKSVYVMRGIRYMTLHTSEKKKLLFVYRYTTMYRSRNYDTSNRSFLSEKCFQNHLMLRVKFKLACQWRQVCWNCNFQINTDYKHERFKKFCTYCNKKKLSGHICYMAPLKPINLSDRFMFVFFDTKFTQDLEKCEKCFEYVPNLICAQQIIQSVKPWRIWLSIVNSVASLFTCSGQTP